MLWCFRDGRGYLSSEVQRTHWYVKSHMSAAPWGGNGEGTGLRVRGLVARCQLL